MGVAYISLFDIIQGIQGANIIWIGLTVHELLAKI